MKGSDVDIIEHLTDEHRLVEALLDQLADSEPGNERRDLVDQLARMLATHMAMEERHLYPLVRETLGDEEAEEAEVEHALARTGLVKLRELVDAPGFGAAVDMMRAGIDHHVSDEEEDLFPQLREQAGEALGSLDAERLDTMIRGGGDLETLSRDEVYQRAKDAGIEGRSTMTKDELVQALRGQ
jgi:hemerythrin superfamily protein